MISPIVVFPDPILREIIDSQVEEIDVELVSKMKSTLNGLMSDWLTAKHLGHSCQIVAIKIQDGIEILINPKILERKGRFFSRIEMDPSFPDLKTSVMRKGVVNVQFSNENGEQIERWFSDVTGRSIQQAIDQLQGKLMIDYANSHRKRSLRGYLGRIEKGKFNANYPVKNQQLIDNE
ncbi:MAG: peptide deformylase [Bacteroidia bacterium]|jgi:peptide deformylase